MVYFGAIGPSKGPGPCAPSPRGAPPGFCSPPRGQPGVPDPPGGGVGALGTCWRVPSAGGANEGSLAYTKITEMFYSKKKKTKKEVLQKNAHSAAAAGPTQTHGLGPSTRARAGSCFAAQPPPLSAASPRVPKSFPGGFCLPSAPRGLLLETSAPQGFPSAPGGALPAPKGALEKPWGKFWLLSPPPRPYLQGHKSFLKPVFLSFPSHPLFFPLIMGCAQEVPGPSSFGDPSPRAACSLARCSWQN